MAIDISQLIASAKQKVGKVAQKFDRDQSMPGFQFAQGGLGNRIQQTFRPQTGTLATAGRQAYERFASTPLTQQQRQVADIGLSGMRGFARGSVGFTGAENLLKNKGFNTFLDYKPQTTAGKVAEFAGGVGGYASGVGKILSPAETFIQAGVTKALPRVAPQVAKYAAKPIAALLAESGSSVPLAATESLTSDKSFGKSLKENISAGVTGRITLGGLPLLAGIAKSQLHLDKILKNEEGVLKAVKYSELYDRLNPGQQIEAINHIKGVLQTVAPDVYKSKRMGEWETRDLGKWLNEAGITLRDRLELARNPELPIGNQARAIRRGDKLVGATPEAPKQDIQPQLETKPIAQVQPQPVTTEKIPTRRATTTLEQKSNLKQQRVKSARPLEDIIRRSEITPQEKIGFIDYLRTPDRVLKKIGLGKESDLIRQKYDDYLKELPTQIDKITAWSKRVSPESNQRIFQKLDGQDVQLTPQETKLTKEIQSYLSEWADRLKLPKEKRISNYITHIFDKDFIQKEFDPDLARLIENRVAGSVYDPFTEKRLGAQGYVEDTWRALDAYVKRATRKVHMDEALGSVKEAAKKLESSQYDYVKNYVDRINMRPTKLDNLVDNSIKQLVGYKFGARPTSYITRMGRQAVYRGTLGLNFGSALRNLSQGANTFAVLGPKYTIKGYSDLVRNGIKELEDVGVLRNNFIEDRVLSAGKQALQKFDKGLFYFFEAAEKINRGSAYYGAKSKALASGMSEQDAIKQAIKTVRDTQFTFGSIDTPVALQSDVAKILTQLQSFTIKQGEFLGEMIGKKDLAGLLRYGLASMAFVYSAGELIGMKPKDIIPSLRFDLPPTLTTPVEIGKALLDVPDQYGNDQTTEEKLQNVGKTLIPYIPAGSQLKKTITGVKAVNEGGVFTPSGMMKYPVAPGTSQMVRGAMFGPSNLPEAQEYYKTKPSPLGLKQTQSVLQSSKPGETYKQVLAKRTKEKQLDEARAKIKSGQSVSSIDGVYLNMDGTTVDVGKVTSMPSTTGYEKVKKQEATYKIVDDVLKLPIDQQQEALKKLGVTPQQAQYYQVANSSVEAKSAFMSDVLNNMISTGKSRNEVLQAIIDMRTELNGKQIASDSVLKELADQNIISQTDYKNLKQIKLVDGKIKRKVSGRKPKKIKLPKVKLIKTKVRKPKKIKVRRIKI